VRCFPRSRDSRDPQVAVDGKSNEITAIPRLLELLDLHAALVTLNAIGCRKEIAWAIVKGKGDDVLVVRHMKSVGSG